MNSAAKKPLYPADRFLSSTQAVSEEQLLIAAIRLDVFSFLQERTSAEALAEKRNWHIRNTELFLNALTAAGYIIKEDGLFANLPDTEYYLNKQSEMYIGDYILFWHEIKKYDSIEERVEKGPTFSRFSDKNGADSYDFYQMAKVAKTEMYTGRVQAFIGAVQSLFSWDSAINALDIGGGSGILSVELARSFPNSHSLIIDQPQVIKLAEEVIKEYEVKEQVDVMGGNFITDDFGGGYDLVIASAIFDFAGDLDTMSEKIYDSVKTGGFMYVDTHMVSDDFTAPKNCIIGWLPSHLDGLDILKCDSEITGAIEKAGFIKYLSGKEQDFPGYVYKK